MDDCTVTCTQYSTPASQEESSAEWQLLFALTATEFPSCPPFKEAIVPETTSETYARDMTNPLEKEPGWPLIMAGCPVWDLYPGRASNSIIKDSIAASCPESSQLRLSLNAPDAYFGQERPGRHFGTDGPFTSPAAHVFQGEYDSPQPRRRAFSDPGCTSPFINDAADHTRPPSLPTMKRYRRYPSSPIQSRRKLMRNKCQNLACQIDLSDAKLYFRRRRICSDCLRAPTIHCEGKVRRFCQQCSCVHDLDEFEGSKRSCREKLRKHRMRLRHAEPQPEWKGSHLHNGDKSN